ncbi:hypothetical protein [Agilicoccus flavus]|uniref:hypothetical protein n=1 Tax=Agilicoccus flavus TaxID=2775968 RepID=UPI0027DA30B8|nr:hypothetical protein [Agilicoccus flavus]
MSNVVVSGAEDLTVVGVLGLAAAAPLAAAGLAAVLLLAGAVVGILATRAVLRLRRGGPPSGRG